jgi:hypothetical protein
VKIEISRVESVFDGMSFDDAGAGAAMFRHNEALFRPSANPLNELNYGALNLALLVALDEWPRAIPPPASRYPRSGDETLVPPLPKAGLGLPDLPSVSYTGLVNELCELDHRQV